MWPVLTQISGTTDFGDCGIVIPLVADWISLFGLIEFSKIEVSNGSLGEQCVTTPFWLRLIIQIIYQNLLKAYYNTH